MTSFLLLVALVFAGLFADGARSSARASDFLIATVGCNGFHQPKCTDAAPITGFGVDLAPDLCYDLSCFTYQASAYTNICFDYYVDDITALNFLTNRVAANVCVPWQDATGKSITVKVPVNLGLLSPGTHTFTVRRLWALANPLSNAFANATIGPTSWVEFTVARVPKPTAISLTANQSSSINDYVVDATIQAQDTVKYPPTGTLTYTADGQTMCTLPVGGACAMNLATGVHRLQVKYSGDSNNLASASVVREIPVGIQPQLIVTGGTPQSAAVNTAFATPLEVRVIDGLSRPYSGIEVVFSASSTGFQSPAAIVNADPTSPFTRSVITDANGVARVTATANAYAGSYTYVAYAAAVNGTNYSSLPTFQLNNYGAPASITATSGTPQSSNLGTAFAAKLGVTVKDAAGVPVPNVTVTFGGPASGATAFLDAASLTTDAGGNASVGAQANGITGSFTLTASVAGVATPASFALSNTFGPGDAATLEIYSGNNQRTNVNAVFAQPLRVRVLNMGGTPVANYPVTFAGGGGASATFDNVRPLTDANGIATVNATANGAVGFYHLTATVAGLIPISFDETNIGPPNAIAAVSGTPQSAYLGAAYAQPLVLKVTDTAGNTVAGAAVHFNGPGSGATAIISAVDFTTDAGGLVSVPATANGILGTFNLTASVAGVTTPASFALSNIYDPALAPASVSIVGGNNQRQNVNAALATALKVKVVDGSNRAVAGVPVSFTGGNGASATFDNATPVTDANGIATVNATANASTGFYHLTATVAGVTPATFDETNIGPPYAIAVVSGSDQSANVNAAYALPLVIKVTDSAGNTVAGAAVHFNGPASGATAIISAVDFTTDAGGLVSVPATANGFAGPFNLTASVAGVATPAVFALTNISTTPAPTVSAITPANGDAAGGTNVTLTGTGFTGAYAVTIGGAAATGVTVVSDTQITATTPAGTYGTASVLVTTPSGSNAANSLYSYFNTPVITGVNQVISDVTTGAAVPYICKRTLTLTGRNFTGVTSLSFRLFDGTTGYSPVSGTIVIQDDNTIINTYITPSGQAAGCASAGLYGYDLARYEFFLKVSTPQATSDAFRWAESSGYVGGSNFAPLVITQHWRNVQAGYPVPGFPYHNADGYGTIDAIKTDPTKGTVVLNQGANPDTGEAGNFTFTYTPLPAARNTAFVDTFAVSVTVQPSPPDPNNSVYVSVTNTSPVLKAANPIAISNAPAPRSVKIDDLASDPDADPLSFVATPTAAPAGCGNVAKVSDQEMSFTPASGFVGACTLSFAATDGVGGTSQQPNGNLIGMKPAAGTLVFNITAAAKLPQTVAFTSTAPATPIVGGTYTPTATGGASPSPVLISATGACSITSGVVSFTGVGACTLSADQAGDDNYDAAPQVQQVLNVAAAPLTAQTVSFTSAAPAAATVGGASYTPTATSTSNLAVAISATGACSITSGVVSFTGVGTCTLNADQAGDATFAAAPQVQQSFTVAAAPLTAQTVSFTSTAPAAATVGGASYTPTATSTSNLTVAISATGACTITSGVVSFTGVGTCTLNADQAGDATFAAAPQVQQNFTVAAAPLTAQTISFTSAAPAVATVGGATYTPIATATSNLAVAISATGACTITSGAVSFTGVGTCTLNANQAGDATFAAAPQVQQVFTVAAAPLTAQTASFTSTAPVTATVGGATYTPIATATSNLAVAISATGACTITSGAVSFTGVGTCTLNANQAGDATFATAPQVQQSFTVAAAPLTAQTISFTSAAPSAATVGGATYTPIAPATSNLAVAISATGACSITNGVVSFTAVGTCTLNANQAGDATFAAAPQVQQSFTVAAAPLTAQTISFTTAAPSAATVGGATYTPIATATSNLAVAISATGACTITNGVVSFTAVGTCTLNADQAGDATFAAAPQVQQVFTVAAAPLTAQTISFTPPSSPVTFGGGPANLVATASSNLAVAFTVDATSSAGACTVSGSSVTYTSAGTCVLNANQPGNATYAAAPQAQQTVTINKAAQVLAFTSATPTAAFANLSFTPQLTGGASGQAIVLSSATPLTCSVNASQVTLVAAGTCTINANQAGTATYAAAAEVSQTFSYNFGPTGLQILQHPADVTVAAGATASFAATLFDGQTINWQWQVSTDAGANWNDVTGASGTGQQPTLSFATTASQNGNLYRVHASDINSYADTNSAKLTVTTTVTAQVITFTKPANVTYSPSGTVVLTATGGASGNPVTFASTTPATCAVSGSTLSFAGAGTCSITASQLGNATFSAATPVSQSFEITAAPQTIAFTTAAPTSPVVGGTYTPTATGGASTSPIVISASGACSIAGGVVSFSGAGTCTISADQAGDANYSAAPQVQQVLTVGKAPQVLAFSSTAPTSAMPGGTYTPVATGGASPSPVVISASGACSITSGVVSFASAGTCTVAADQAGDDNYTAAPQVQQVIAVGKAPQVLAFTSTAPTSPVVGGTYTPVATGGASTSPVLISASGACSITSGVVSFASAGTCTISADQAGDDNYTAAPQAQQVVTVGKAPQTITFTPPADQTYVPSGTVAVSASSDSGLTVAFASTSKGVCTVSGTTVSFVSAGTCSITASQAGNSNFNAATDVTKSFAIGKAAQTVAFTGAAPTSPVVGGTYTPTATGGAGTSPVVISATGTCSLASGIVSFSSIGACAISAAQAGDANYDAAPQVQQVLNVAAAPLKEQTISFTSAAPVAATVGGASYTPVATATSNLTVAISATGACTITSGAVSFTAVGTCTLNANQLGDATFAEAPQVQQGFTVAAAPLTAQTISFTSTAPVAATVGGASYTPIATATSGLTVALTVAPASSAICTITSGVVSIISVGTCTLNADQAGNASFAAAPQVQQSFTVVAAPLTAQTISFTSAAPVTATVGGASYTPIATATSGLTVALTVAPASSAICTITSGVVNFTSVGTCTLNANQSGNASFAAASQVQQSFNVGHAPASPTVTAIAPALGATSGLTAVTITGTGFTAATTVKFGANAAMSVTFTSATSLTATSPAGAAGTVDVTVTDGGVTSATLGADQFTYGEAPTLAFGPADAVVANGSSVSFTAQAAGGTTPLRIFWQSSADGGNTWLQLAVSPSVNSSQLCTLNPFAVDSSKNGYKYRVLLSNAYGSVASVPATLIVVEIPTVTAISPASGPVAGSTVVTIAGTNFTSSTTVNFGATAATGVTFNSATSLTAMAPAGAAGTIDVLVTNIAGTSATSAADQYTYFIPAAVTTNPANSTVTEGGTASFTAAASGNPTATVQWQTSTGGTTFTDVAGATSASLSVPSTQASQNGSQWRAVFSNAFSSATTTVATLTVNVPPAISANPSDTVVAAGGTVTLTAAATGLPAPTVQWQSRPSGGIFTDIIGATSPTLSLSNVQSPLNAYQYQAVFTNAAGSATTTVAKLSVQYAPTVATHPISKTITAGNSVSLSAFASSNPSPTVQWEFSSDGGANYQNVAGATNVTLATTNVPASYNGYLFRAVFTNVVGSATSNFATLTVNSAPVVTTDPNDVSVIVGGTATFTAAATGFPTPTVKWQSSSDGSTFSDIAGATSATLTVANAQLSLNGWKYQAIFSNSEGSTNSNVATLTVAPDSPTITAISPNTRNVPGGTYVVIDGTNFTGITAANVTFGGVAVSSIASLTDTSMKVVIPAHAAGVVDVVITNGAGKIVTAANAFTYFKIDQTISEFNNPGAQVYSTNGSVGVSANATSGLGVTISSDTLSVCTVSGSIINYVSGGDCTIRVSQAGDGTYNAAPDVTQTFAIGMADQNITATATPASIVFGATSTVAGSGGAGTGGFTYSLKSGLCTVDATSGVATPTGGTGTCVITATKAADANYNAATADASITLGIANQIITFAKPTDVAFTPGGTVILTATGGASGNAVTFASTTPAVCSVTGSTVTTVSAGPCSITASQLGNVNYADAADVIQSFAIVKATQTISFIPPATQTYILADTVAVSASSDAGLTVSFASNSAGVCMVTGTSISFVAAGTCSITASQAGNSNYIAATDVTKSFTIGKARQTVAFTTAAPTSAVLGETYTPIASGGAGTAPVVISATGACSISGGVVSFSSTGTCTISADQAGDANYTAAPQAQQSITVGKAPMTVAFTSTAPTSPVVGGTYAPAATGGASTSPVLISATGVCSMASGKVSFSSAGACTISADQAGDDNYTAAPQAQQVIAVGKAPQTVAFTSTPPTSPLVGGSYTPTATGGASTSPVVISATGACSMASGVVSFSGAGACTISANQAGDTNYTAAPQALQAINVGKAAQTITFTPPADQIYAAGGSVDVIATSDSGLTVSFTSTSTGVCTVAGTTVSLVSAGTCLITASQAGNNNYTAAPQALLAINVGKAAQTITFTPPADQIYAAGGSVDVIATSDSGLTVSFASTSTGVCTVSGTTVSFVSAGTCALTASQAGNSNYTAATDVTKSFAIGKAAQTISFNPPAAQTYSQGGTIAVSASSDSGLAVSFASNSTGVCTISGSTVSYVSAGTCSITASQAGNNNYNAANDVTKSFAIGKAPQTVAITTAAPTSPVVGGTYTPAATGGAGTSPVLISASGTCSIASGVVSFTGAGTCTISADQAGDANYIAALQIQQMVTVGKVPTTIALQVAPTAVKLGQAVILTATVSPVTSTGAVSFSDGTTVICPAVIPVAGVATCTTSFSVGGTHNLSASFSGTNALASATSSPEAIEPVDQKTIDGKTVGSFVSDRSNMIVSNLFDMNRQIDRLNQAQQSQEEGVSSGNFATEGKGDLPPVLQSTRLGGPSGASITAAGLSAKGGPTDVGNQDAMAFQSFLYNYLKAAGQSGNLQAFNFSGPMDMQANFGNGQATASFRASLSQMTNWQQQHDKTEMNALGFGHAMPSTVFMPLDVWVEGNYATYSGNRSGQFGMVTLGADYVFNPNFIAGIYSQFDMMNQTSGTAINGKGWMAGPYVTARISDNVFWQARGGWGTSSNTINGSDEFRSTRWLVSSSLSGRWRLGDGLAFSPTASFTYFEDRSDAYFDSFGITIPGTKTSLGQLKLSPELSYGFATDDGLWIEPSFAPELIWNFASTNVDGLGQLDGAATGPAGLRARVKAGINFKTPSGMSIDLNGAYDGIGTNGFSSFSGQATLSVPLN